MNAIIAKCHKDNYYSIIKFYDFADDLLNTVESKEVEDAESQLYFIEPIIEKIEQGTDLLISEYQNYMVSSRSPGLFSQKKLEEGLNLIYNALLECQGLPEV